MNCRGAAVELGDRSGMRRDARPRVRSGSARLDARDRLEARRQVVGVFLPPRGLRHKLVELLPEHGGLVMGHSEVGAAAEIAVALESPVGTPAIVERMAAVKQVIAHAGDGPPLPGWDVL